MEIPEDKIREFAVGVLDSKEGRATARYVGYELHGYRRPNSLTVFASNTRMAEDSEHVFEGEKLEELKALVMQKVLERK